MPDNPPNAAAKGSLLLLVVDDEPNIAKYMGLVLTRAGYHVLTAFSAEEGWELFQRQAPQVRAVVTDLILPGAWNGLELARRVRQASPDVPVLLVTGQVDLSCHSKKALPPMVPKNIRFRRRDQSTHHRLSPRRPRGE